MTVQFSLAFLENLLVMLVVLTKIPLTPINSFILSLASADFMQSIAQQLPMVIEKFQHTWTMGSIVCKVFSTGRSVFPQAGVLVIALIGVERYRSLDRTNGVAFSVKMARILILAVWVLCLGTALPIATWFDVITYPDGTKRCSYVGEFAAVAIIYTVATSVVFFLLPIMMTWFCYMGVIYRMMKSSRTVAQRQINNATNVIRQQRILRVSRTCVLIAVVFTVCWTPINIMLMYVTLTSDRSVLNMMQYVWLIAAFASYINPLIYGLMMTPFREALIQFFRCQQATSN